MNDTRITLASIFIPDCIEKPNAPNNCASCGRQCQGIPLSRAVSDNFADFEGFLRYPGSLICVACVALLSEKRLRWRHLVVTESEILCEAQSQFELWPYLVAPPKCDHIISMLQSRKKHGWLYAGVSTNIRQVVATDNRSVVIDHTSAETTHVIDVVRQFIQDYQIPRAQVLSGKYSMPSLHRAGVSLVDILRVDAEILAPARRFGCVEVLATCCPKGDEKKSNLKFTGDSIMIDPEDAKAAEFLAAVAEVSAYRKRRGLNFWCEGFFEHRIQRVRSLAFSDMLERLMQLTAADSRAAKETLMPYVAQLTPDDQFIIESAIRKRPKLALALAYSKFQDDKQEKQQNADRNRPNKHDTPSLDI